MKYLRALLPLFLINFAAAQVAVHVSDIKPVNTATVLGRATAGPGSAEQLATTGTGAVVQATSPVLVTPNLGTPSTLVATNATGMAAGLTAGNASSASAVPLSGVTGLGTGVATALAVNVGVAGAPVVNGGALGTPSSGVATNLTGTAAGLTAGTANAAPAAGLTGTTLASQVALAPGLVLNRMPLLQQSGARVLRIYYGGTSIENSTNAGARQWLESLKTHYGDSGNYTQPFVNLGGSQSVNVNGWLKQPYGGLGYYRIRGDSVSTTNLDLYQEATQLVIRTSKESDGGSFDVYVDGAYSTSISCSGAQSYNNETVINLPSREFCHVTLHPPASGYAYVEAIDWNQNNNGIQVMDGTLGGSTFKQAQVVAAATGSQAAPIAISGWNGVDSYMLKTSSAGKPDVVIFSWVVNDATAGTSDYTNYYQPGLDRLVTQTAANGQKLILFIEMGGHTTMPADSGNAAFKLIRAQMQSYAALSHVTVIDWHGSSYPPADTVTDQSVWQTWCSQFYGATITNLATASYTGDFIHPNAYGHSIVSEGVSSNSTVQSLGQLGTPANNPAQMRAAPWPFPSTNLASTSVNIPVGVTREETDNLGVPQTIRSVGYSSFLNDQDRSRIPMWYSASQINFATALNATIAGAGTSDQFGKYVTQSGAGHYVSTPQGGSASTEYTLTWLIAPGQGTIRVRDAANTTGVTQYVVGKSAGLVDGAPYANDTTKPQPVSVTIRGSNTTFYVVLTGTFYGEYMTPTSYPCLTPPTREFYVAKDLSAGLWNVGDILANSVVAGQSYTENINSHTIGKTALSRRVWKPDNNHYALYTSAGNYVKPFTLGGAITYAYNNQAGGYTAKSNSNPQGMAIAEGPITALATYTITGHTFVSQQCAIYLFNGGSSRTLQLDPVAGTWTESGTKIQFYPPDEQWAVTFQMPSSALMGANTTWSVNVVAQGAAQATAEWSAFTLAEGSSACLSANPVPNAIANTDSLTSEAGVDLLLTGNGGATLNLGSGSTGYATLTGTGATTNGVSTIRNNATTSTTTPSWFQMLTRQNSAAVGLATGIDGNANTVFASNNGNLRFGYLSGSTFIEKFTSTNTAGTASQILTVDTNKKIETYAPSSCATFADFSVGGVGLAWTRPDGTYIFSMFSYDTAGGDDNLAFSSRSDFVFGNNGGLGGGSERMRLKAAGNLLLGTTTDNGTDLFQSAGNIATVTAGKTFRVKSGSNALAGTVTLVAGAATITSTAIDVNTVIVLSIKTSGGTPSVYEPNVAVASGSATITGLATDTSTYNWIGLKVN